MRGKAKKLLVVRKARLLTLLSQLKTLLSQLKTQNSKLKTQNSKLSSLILHPLAFHPPCLPSFPSLSLVITPSYG
jgi:hypothetical protein